VSLALVARAALADDLTIPFTTQKLASGMTVTFHEDHSLPVVAVDMAYKAGSRFDPPGRTGLASLVGDLMFSGTRRVPAKALEASLEQAGAFESGDSGLDRVEVVDVAPPTALARLLWLEADRQRGLGASLTADKLTEARAGEAQVGVAISADNTHGLVDYYLPALLFPESHPYHHAVIGSQGDRDAVTLAEAQGFVARLYDPANAALVVAGDFDPAVAKATVARLFDAAPSHGAPPDPPPTANADVTTLTNVVRQTVPTYGDVTKVAMAWRSPRRFAPGDAELELLATVMAGGKGSRLHQALVEGQKLADAVEAAQEGGALASRFVIRVAVRPDVALDKVEAILDRELDRLRATLVTDDELRRAESGVETAFVSRLETVRGRAAVLVDYQMTLGDPGFLPRDLDRYRRATAADLQAVAARVLLPGARVVLRVVPAKAKRGGGP
jgi:predicted Zn-dependent peptidase